MGKRLTTEEFIEKARLVHGDKFDYSLVEYSKSCNKVKIICEEHGEFFQTANDHLSGKNGCKKCNGNVRLTTEEFIEKARKIHGDKYDYSLVEYVDSHSDVKIKCKVHDMVFIQAPTNHLGGKGCPECRYIAAASKTRKPLEDFITKANLVHDNKFDYSKVVYTKNNSKVCIICPEHGEFWQRPNSHLNGIGCSYCSGRYTSNTEEFIEKARKIHGNKYDYSLVEYVRGKDNVKIRCIEHDFIFNQAAQTHLSGAGCPKCSKTYTKTTEEFIADAKLVHGDRFDYSLVDYIGVEFKVKIICRKHNHIFLQTPGHHLDGNACPICKSSKGEIKIYNFLVRNNIKHITQHQFNDCKNKKSLLFDFYLPEHNICIEYDGEQHFRAVSCFGGEKNFVKTQEHDKIKNEYCKNQGIKLIRIPYTDFKNIEEILNKAFKKLD